MMHLLEQEKYWIAHDPDGTVAFGKDRGEVWTAKEEWEEVDEEAAWVIRLLELGVTQNKINDALGLPPEDEDKAEEEDND